MRRIKIKQDLCMACMNCFLGCIKEHNEKGKTIYDIDLSDLSSEGRNHIALDSYKKPAPIFCRHCDEPECVYTCMSGAMTKDEETGQVSYNKEKCSSCFMCVMSCPFGVLKINEGTMQGVLKCDMCDGKQIPGCVENCPTGCLYIEDEGVEA